jgi:hypothetical protein
MNKSLQLRCRHARRWLLRNDSFFYFSHSIVEQIIMVFRGQDAWRQHRLFTNLHKFPIPGFSKAVAIYGAFVCVEYAYKLATMPASASHGHHHH